MYIFSIFMAKDNGLLFFFVAVPSSMKIQN